MIFGREKFFTFGSKDYLLRKMQYMQNYPQPPFPNYQNYTPPPPLQRPSYGTPNFKGFKPDYSNLRKTLESQKSSNRINLNDSYIRDEGCKILSNFLMENQFITSLDLKGNNISGRGLTDLCEALRMNKVLKTLSLEWNTIGTDSLGLESLASYLCQNSSLAYLDVRNNKINASGASVFATIIRNNSSLLSLDLRWNELGNQGGNLLKLALSENNSVQNLELTGNNISESLMQEIYGLLERNKKNGKNDKKIESNFNAGFSPGFTNENERNNFPNEDNSKLINDVNVLKEENEKLGKALGEERRENMIIKKKLEEENEIWKGREFEMSKIIEELEDKVREGGEEKLKIKDAMRELIDQNENLQNKAREVARIQEERLAQQSQEMDELEKRHRITVDKLINDNSTRVKELNQEWEDRYNSFEFKLKDMENDRFEKIKEIKFLTENAAKMKIMHEEQIREIQYKIGEQENLKFNSRLKFLENKVTAVEEGREAVDKKNEELVKEIKENEIKRGNEIQNLEKENLFLKEQNEMMITKNREFELINEKFKNDLRLKDNVIEKLETEINNLNELMEKRKIDNRKYLMKYITESKEDRNNYEIEKENSNKKNYELQNVIRNQEAENTRLRHEYQRLAEALQSALNKSILDTFANNNFI